MARRRQSIDNATRRRLRVERRLMLPARRLRRACVTIAKGQPATGYAGIFGRYRRVQSAFLGRPVCKAVRLLSSVRKCASPSDARTCRPARSNSLFLLARLKPSTRSLSCRRPRFAVWPPGKRPAYLVLRHAYPLDPHTFGQDLYDLG